MTPLPEQLILPANWVNENDPSELHRMLLAESSCSRPVVSIARHPWQAATGIPAGQRCSFPPPHAVSVPVLSRTNGAAQRAELPGVAVTVAVAVGAAVGATDVVWTSPEPQAMSNRTGASWKCFMRSP